MVWYGMVYLQRIIYFSNLNFYTKSMEASTTIKKIFTGNKITVPKYQRAYSWDKGHTTTFLKDLEDHMNSTSESPYYFGHFLFEEMPKDKDGFDKYGVIDGQQRLTTIVIFLSALFQKLKSIRSLEEKEQQAFEDIIKRDSDYRFETVGYDDQFFKDYVINQIKKDKEKRDTTSAKRIENAFVSFNEKLAGKDEAYLKQMLDTVQNASCTTHQISDTLEAVQMFLFQNNRGKDPTALEVIKAQFMFHVHLYGASERVSLIEELIRRFAKIYQHTESLRGSVTEGTVLTYTLKVYFNRLGATYSLDKVEKELSSKGKDSISFIKDFTQALETTFEHLVKFYSDGEDYKNHHAVHSLISLGGIGIALPFILKAYKFGLEKDQLSKLCRSLESLLIRNELTPSQAKLIHRIQEFYKNFTQEKPDIKPIIDRIDYIKKGEGHSDYYSVRVWRQNHFEDNLRGEVDHTIARFLLWKYENHLISQGKNGYVPRGFDSIIKPQLEHISPQTPNNGDQVASGYDEYDEVFLEQGLLHCFGNYLLISQSHNCSIGNKPFAEKRASYKKLAQHREVREMTDGENPFWGKEQIEKRQEKIVAFLLENF